MAHTHWSSRLTFIMASAGAAIGLGNIWRFPYMAGENGGAAFVLVYLLFVMILGIPMMASEVLIGRRSKKNPADGYRKIAIQSLRSKRWWLAGALQILTGFLILSYYSVIAGWVVHYIFESATGAFVNTNAVGATRIFNQLLSSPILMLFWDTVVIMACIVVVSLGIHRGLEKVIYVMFPTLLVLVILLIAYAIKTASFAKGFEFLFSPDFTKLTPNTVLLALGQAFFSLGIGTGIMLTYGTYVTDDTPIIETSVLISAADTMIALIAGLTIFPIVFATGQAPNAGPSLIFKTLPIAFGHMPFGSLFSTLFFIMLLLASFTSAIALLEPAMMFIRERFSWSRVRATTTVGFAAWALSLGTIASFNVGSHHTLFGKTFFDLLDFVTSNIMLPLGGLTVATFTGWMMFKKDVSEELGITPNVGLFKAWRIGVRYVAPIAVTLIFAKSLGVL